MRTDLATALLCAGLLHFSLAVVAEPVPVELRRSDDGWQLLRGGEPYLIRGAGGSESLALDGEDLSSLKTGFFVTLEAGRSPVTIYLDSIRFVQ